MQNDEKNDNLDTTETADTTKNLVRELRSRIVAWNYPPQFALVEETLAAEFNVSRSPIRQALTHLAAEGLVERLPRRGFRVKQLQLRDVEELYEYRLALEVQVVRSLAHKGLAEKTLIRLQTMWQNVDELRQKSVAELAALDEQFHIALATEHGNRLILQKLEAINERLFAFREIDMAQADRIKTTSHEHLQLLHALLAHDADLASELVRHNINSGLGNVENTVMRLVSRSYLEQS